MTEELTVEQKLELARQVGYRLAFQHFTNTPNPVDFPTTELEDEINGDAAKLESRG
jgi:hypothetical protein